VHRLEPHDCIGDVLIASDLSREPRGGPIPGAAGPPPHRHPGVLVQTSAPA
jgi:hypothetical protein